MELSTPNSYNYVRFQFIPLLLVNKTLNPKNFKRYICTKYHKYNTSLCTSSCGTATCPYSIKIVH